jgi:hypothetical protein
MKPERLERDVERNFMRWCNARGLLAVKLGVLKRAGFPDRMVLLPGGRAIFVELKRPGEDASPLQKSVHRRLRDLGFDVFVCDESVKAIAAVLRAIREAEGP